jgi:hypothetical protein
LNRLEKAFEQAGGSEVMARRKFFLFRVEEELNLFNSMPKEE